MFKVTDEATDMAESLCFLFDETEINDISQFTNPLPIFSYKSPLTPFWEGFIQGLFDRGFTKEQVKTLLKSKEMRWFFDGPGDEKIQNAAWMMAFFNNHWKRQEAP